MEASVQRNLDDPWSAADHFYMARALALASQALQNGEIPVGSVVAAGEDILGEGFNQPISACDPTAHAEIVALRRAAAQTGNYRLTGATLYVTLEPCVMCAGAIVTARIKRLVFAARDLRFGGVRSKFRLADSDLLNHRVTVQEGLLAADAGELLSRFFAQKRG